MCERVYLRIALCAALLMSCPFGPVGAKFLASVMADDVGLILVALLFALSFGCALAFPWVRGRRGVAVVCMVVAACFPGLVLALPAGEAVLLGMVLYAVVAGVALACWVDWTMLSTLPWRLARPLSWPRTAACAAGAVVLCQVFAVWSPDPLTNAIGVAMVWLLALSALLVARPSAEQALETTEVPPRFNLLITSSFVTFGAGISLYAGSAVLASAKTGSALPCTAFMLGCCAVFVVGSLLEGVAVRDKFGIVYGNVSRYSAAAGPVVGMIALILLTHATAVGYFVLAVVPSWSVIPMGVMLFELADGHSSRLPGVVRTALVYAAVGAAAGAVLVFLLWTIDDANLRFQLITL